jgi:hypothetical protein
MQIHLSKPGGQREGPFTIDQINRDLANRKYRDADYWAWYEGLDAWVPLHSVPGVLILPESPAEPPPAPKKAPAPNAQASENPGRLLPPRRTSSRQSLPPPRNPPLTARNLPMIPSLELPRPMSMHPMKPPGLHPSYLSPR